MVEPWGTGPRSSVGRWPCRTQESMLLAKPQCYTQLSAPPGGVHICGMYQPSRPKVHQCLWEGVGCARLPSTLLLLSERHPPISASLAYIGRLIQNRSTSKSDSLAESPLGPWELGRGRSRQSPGRGQLFWGKGSELLHLGQREGNRDTAPCRFRQHPLERGQGEQSQRQGLIIYK